MYQCKHARKNAVHKHTKSKILISLLAMALVCCVSISGTLAWVVHQTNPVVNTFTYGDIHITLEETGAVDGTNEYTMVRGIDILKDPTVTVKAGSEDCWLFVELEESDNFGEYLTYTPERDWEPLTPSTTGSTYVYYRTVEYADSDQVFMVLENNTVQVKNTVTKELLHALEESGEYPTLTVTAYAVQQEGITDPDDDLDTQAADAWAMIQGS